MVGSGRDRMALGHQKKKRQWKRWVRCSCELEDRVSLSAGATQLFLVVWLFVWRCESE